ncbi:MAG: hypothetical protein ACKO7A_17345, partial [Microcystis sp.]
MLIFNSKAVVERRGFRPKFSMNRREFVALVGVGGAMACAPEILGTATDQEMTPAQAADGFVKVTGITLKELEAKGSFLDKKSPVGSLL